MQEQIHGSVYPFSVPCFKRIVRDDVGTEELGEKPSFPLFSGAHPREFLVRG
jgi:hypothetical protein